MTPPSARMPPEVGLRFSTPFADALAIWRRDRALLLPLAGITMFLPHYARLMLVPDMPPRPAEGGEEAALAWTEAVSAWAGEHGLWYLIGPAVALYGALAVAALYLDPVRPTLGHALARAGALYLRYLLASILVALPLSLLLVPALASQWLLVLFLAPIFYVFGRTMLIAPAIVAEAPTGATTAIARSWRLTTGEGWVLACIYAATILGPQIVGGLVLAIGAAAGTGSLTNPVILAITAAIAALLVAGAALALALVAVAVYRRLARKGT